ncbi:MAG: efflux RND transporter periplasmic adaptor subunit [Chitinophagales bacterium]|nr:efflux RND transporter periplasmic adaptor subunit [Chitinophagales bacterium]
MKTYYLFFIALLLISCSKPEEIEKLKTQLGKAKSNYEAAKKSAIDLKNEIEELEKQIATIEGVEIRKGKLVTTIPVSAGEFNHYIEVQGTAQSEKNITVSTDMGGIVTAIYVDEGSRVGKGRVLAQLDNTILLQQVEEIKTSLDLAKTVYEKQKILWDQNIGSEIQFLQAKNNKESLETKLKTTYAQLEKMKIKSPIDGYVDEVFIKLGELASPGNPAIRVVNLNMIEVEASVPENYLGSVTNGEKVTVYFPALEMEKEAIVKSVGQVINPNNRTFNVLVKITNEDASLKPNLLAVLKIMDYYNNSVISIPNRLIHFGRDSKFVYVAKNENGETVAVKKEVETGISYKGKVEIITGLDDSDILVDEGYRDVTHGELLTIASKDQITSDGRESED